MLMCPTHRICFEKEKFIIHYIPKVSPIYNWYKSHVYSFQDRLTGLSSWIVPHLASLSRSSIGKPLPSLLMMMPLTLPCFKHMRWVSFNATLSLQTFPTMSQAFPGKTGLWKMACLMKFHKVLDVPNDQWIQKCIYDVYSPVLFRSYTMKNKKVTQWKLLRC